MKSDIKLKKKIPQLMLGRERKEELMQCIDFLTSMLTIKSTIEVGFNATVQSEL